MSPLTVARLHQLDVPESKSLKLDFFFYTDTEPKAQSLAIALKGLGYDARGEKSDGGRILVTGTSTPIRMDESTILSWTEMMCRTGFAHDADFDGWGASPE